MKVKQFERDGRKIYKRETRVMEILSIIGWIVVVAFGCLVAL